jgi:hypothetical protein
MLYKTICLNLLEQHPMLYEELRQRRLLLTTMERLANELKANHDAWKESLSQARMDASESQIASEAMELALKDLYSVLPPADEVAFHQQDATAFTPPA